MRSSSLLLAAALTLCAADARAYWLREEWVGVQPEIGRSRFRVLDFAAYDSHWGFGVGSTAFEFVAGAWDLPRHPSHDATGHYFYEFFPLKAYLAVASWKGPPYFHFTNSRAADRSVGKVELYGSYCDWARMTQFNEVDPNPFNVGLGRRPVPGTVGVRVLDYGIRVDQGLGESVSLAASVGRLELRTANEGAFRAKDFGRWYAAADLYFGTTHGSDYGGGAHRLFSDSWDWLRALFGASVVHREPLSSTSD